MPVETIRTIWTDLATVVHSCMEKVSVAGLDCIIKTSLNIIAGRVSSPHPEGNTYHPIQTGPAPP